MELNYERMGKIIKAVRIARGLSQADLAESIDLSVPYKSFYQVAYRVGGKLCETA